MNEIKRLKILCDLTVELTKIKHSTCNHLAIENFAPKMLESLLDVFNPPLIAVDRGIIPKELKS